MRKREREAWGRNRLSSTRDMAERDDAPRGQSLELRGQTLCITGSSGESGGESPFLLARTLSALMVKVSLPSTREARVDGY